MEIKYRFYKKQNVSIPLSAEDRKTGELTTMRLHHYDSETYYSDIAKGSITLVTMVRFQNGRISRFFIFIKYPKSNEFEFLKTYRAADRAKYLLRGVK